MSVIGVVLMFFGVFLMYDAYEGIHHQAQSHPVLSLKAALP